MHLLHVFLFAVIHPLANTRRRRFWSFLVHRVVILLATLPVTAMTMPLRVI
jgi:hypothetical protein